MPNALTETVGSMAGFIADYAIALAAVGTLAMALLEAWKKLAETRARFHRDALWTWLQDGTSEPLDAYCELVHLTTGVRLSQVEPPTGSPAAQSPLFALGVDKMMGQVQEAADLALGEPDRYPALYRFLCGAMEPKELKQWRTAAARPATARTTDAAAKKRADLYATLHQMARRKLDAFQLATKHRWALLNQRNALGLGAVIMLVSLIWMDSQGFERAISPGGFVRILLMSVIGGFLAPVAKDLVSSLRRLKRGV